MRVPATLTAKAFTNPPGLLRASELNSRAVHAAEIPAANGIATARALAGMYAALAGADRSGALAAIDRDRVRAMSAVESEGEDLVLLLPTRFSAGFMKSVDNRRDGAKRDSVLMGPNDAAFGHVGAGGSIGFADPGADIGFAYVMNQLGHGVMLNERGQSLIDAVYECLGRR
jgi:CubicO group peptidase (beta-lactamase class C family)